MLVAVRLGHGSPVRLEYLRPQSRVDHRLEAGDAQHADELLFLAGGLLDAVHDPVRVLGPEFIDSTDLNAIFFISFTEYIKVS